MLDSRWISFSRLRAAHFAAVGCCLLVLACGGGGGPTSPPLAATATIDGQVVDFGASDGAHGPVTDVTVRVEGTPLSTVTDGQGRFGLAGVPAGDQRLSFERSGQVAALAVDGIRPGERIVMVVLVDGGTVQVQSMDRGAGGGSVTLEKSTQGEDADRPPGPSIPVGGAVEWVYAVTNTGTSELSRIAVVDDRGVVVSCPSTVLAPGESMECTGRGTAEPGQYANLGTVTGVDPEGNSVEASDPSHYFGTAGSVALEKSTNGLDADEPPGPTIPVGAPVLWEYLVVNDGAVELLDVVVTDDQGVAVDCPRTGLLPGESMTCTGRGAAVAGQYANLGTVTATDSDGLPVEDSDPSHYFGDGETGSFTVELQPDSWNTNWPGSSGTVSAKIQGGDLTLIEPGSIVLFEADPTLAATPIEAPEVTGNHVRARFAKPEAFAVLVTPQTGETRVVTVRFVAGGATVELQAAIQIVGPPI